jgi:hypothetical protein
MKMRKALTSLFSHQEPTAAQMHQREWKHCLSQATSQNEIDEINDLFSDALIH